MEKLSWILISFIGFLSVLEVELKREQIQISGSEDTIKRRIQRSTSPPSITAYVGQNVSVNCSISTRYNSRRDLQGRIVILGLFGRGRLIPYTTEFNGNLFIVKTNVSVDGRYECAVIKRRYGKRISISKTSVEFLPFKSSLLTIPQIRIIKTWLKETNTFGSYKTCWDTSMKDLSRSNFFDECGNNSPRFDPSIKTWWNTITVFKLFEDNRILGGFADLPWIRPLSFDGYETQYSNKTFVFELDPSKKYPMLNDGQNAVCRLSRNGPCFGDQELFVDYNIGFPFTINRMNSFVFGPSNLLRSKEAQMEVFYKADAYMD